MGYVLVSRTGDEEWTCRWYKLSIWLLIRYWKGCWSIPTVGWWSWKLKFAKECVTIHLPNGVAPKMNFAAVNEQKLTAWEHEKMEECRSVWVLKHCSDSHLNQTKCKLHDLSLAKHSHCIISVLLKHTKHWHPNCVSFSNQCNIVLAMLESTHKNIQASTLHFWPAS